jgi:muconolactone D-isomerase
MLYHIDFRLEYPATMTQQELLRIWSKEAEAALEVKSQGIIVDLWKCIGTRRVFAIVNVESPDILDQILMDLPIMKEMGQHVNIEVTPLRRYEDFAADVRERIQELTF